VQARYLKAVVKPLDPGATVDRRFSSVFVTELQLLLVAQVRTRTPWQDSARAVATIGGRTQITRTVAYDLSGILTRITASRTPDVRSYLLTNGVSYADKLGEFFVVNARVARQDQDLSHGHEGLFVYSSSLTATPLPTLSHSLVYSGQSLWGLAGFQTTNALSFFNRASPYRGIGLLAGAVYSVNTGPRGAVLKSDNVTCSATVTPNPKLTLSGTFGHADTVATGGGAPRSSSSANQITAGATATPVPALYLSIGLTRLVSSSTPHTLASGSAGFSPFPGGNLQLAVNYLETYQDPNQTSRLFSPSIRWNVRPNALLTVSWTLLDSNAVGAATQARTFEADLQISL
jgi:hypothetical protein